MSVLSENIIENAIAIIKAQLKAHEADLEEELETSTDKAPKVTIEFKLTVTRMGPDKHLHKLGTNIRRKAIKPDVIDISERQPALPFKAVAK